MSSRKSEGEKSAAVGGKVKVSRRTVMKSSVIAGAAAVITTRKSLAQEYPEPPPPPPAPEGCSTNPGNSPATTPFVDNLPIPTPAIPRFLNPFPTKAANIGAGEAARDDHQRWEEFPPFVTYESVAMASTHQFHSDLLPSYVWAFDGRYPGQTYLGHYGVSSLVRFRNALPADHGTSAINQLTVHLHNGHTPSESDGFAGDFFDEGLWKDNHYPNVYAGVDTFGGIGDPREAMHTFWYHDHRAEFTAPNNNLGLNGQFYLYDQKDPGHEFASPGSLRLPGYYGVTDIPLHLLSVKFCPANAAGRNEIFITGGGDKFSINGKIQPKLKVRRRKYRLRVVNTGVVKEWNIALYGSDGQQKPMTVVAVDANFVETPFDVSDRNLNIPVASRCDIIVDFSQFAAGTSVYLREGQAQFVDGTDFEVAPGLSVRNVAMRFDVVEREFWFPKDTPPIPSQLTTYPDPIVSDDFFEWRFTLDGAPRRFRINGEVFDHNVVMHAVLKGTAEEWDLANDVIAGNWTHPVHIHFEEGRVLSRTHTNRDSAGNIVSVDNVPLLPEELGRRDVYRLPGQDRLKIRLRFRDFVGRYLIHCHNMGHEDNFMMVRWDIVDTVDALITKRREIDHRRMMAGLPPQYDEQRGMLAMRPQGRSKKGLA